MIVLKNFLLLLFGWFTVLMLGLIAKKVGVEQSEINFLGGLLFILWYGYLTCVVFEKKK